MDYIHLNDMEFYGYHGALPEENKLGQRFRLTVSLATDLAEAGQTDDLSKTMNYAEVYEMCKNIVEGEAVHLIETVAETVAGTIMTDFAEKVNGVRVVLIKPDPPIRGHYSSVSVEITRGRFS
ncbi:MULTISPECIES: dihydroneopterin aldolase [Sporosarcina]|uniref:dihydroneopterin aldolase n=1 Tax=Sporosarcina TaxID=1569 RepID=UPI000A149495|nr:MULTISPECIES: dihydroneopterin aldolase [Sporosarcina]ARJ39142.1 dihydroneopterin aldolase [Sporosarcina ureae]PIC66311.1 dihydroneopterin aldolase [Sporosarcina sp. P16a]PIC82287.1 dihydroneopterin aldolase [Sporosarcina sp. P1]PIC84977.1 dihydroneopterin aldolase [Sporosarcina sp. P20a]PIC87025.1 dihydroneopterin aldolase [Sporosarcina sp. P21c]